MIFFYETWDTAAAVSSVQDVTLALANSKSKISK